MRNSNILAIDLAKNVFQVCKTTLQGKTIYNRKVSRVKLKEVLNTEKSSLVAMESCATSHYWARYALELGHSVKVIDARTVKGFLIKQKTDANDAFAIAIAATQGHIKSNKIFSAQEQSLQSLERARHLAMAQRTAQSNQIRALLAEFGFTIPKGLSALRKGLPSILEHTEADIPTPLKETLYLLWEQWLTQLNLVDELSKLLDKAVKSNSICKRLMKLEGVGPISALGLALRLGKTDIFKDGRGASASIGLTPKQHSSGGKERIGHISKVSADKRLRSILFEGAQSVIKYVSKRPAKTQKEAWLQALVLRRGAKIAAIALANKTVRTAYAILRDDSEYQAIPI
jgi:transposase